MGSDHLKEVRLVHDDVCIGFDMSFYCVMISIEYNFKVPSHSDSIFCVEIEQVFFERRRCYGLMTLNGQGSPVNRKE